MDRAQILAASDFEMELVSVPEWGGDVYVRTFSASDRDRFESDYLASKTENIRAKLAVMTVCDEERNLLFTQDDIPALGAKSAKALDRIFEVAIRLNGIGKEDIEAAEKN